MSVHLFFPVLLLLIHSYFIVGHFFIAFLFNELFKFFYSEVLKLNISFCFFIDAVICFKLFLELYNSFIPFI